MTSPSAPSVIAQVLQDVAANLEWHMQARSMTEDALARASGVSPRTVGNFLRPTNRKSARGTSRSFPSGTLANLCKLAVALGVEPWQLMCNLHSARFHEAMEQAFIERTKAMTADSR